MMLSDIQAPPPGALEWVKGIIAGATPVLIVLWRWWEAVRKKLDKAADAADEATRQLQALHRSVDKLKELVQKELGGVRERLIVLEDRSDRGERERTITHPEGFPIQPERSRAHRREPTRAMGAQPVESDSGGIPAFTIKDEGSSRP